MTEASNAQAQTPENRWNRAAANYNQFVLSELEDTRTYLDAIGLKAGKSVLDVCCGPGRISILAAERGCTVEGIDSADKMLAWAKKNAEDMGVAERCTFRLLDWNCVLPGQNVQKADYVIASRCGAMMDVEKLSKLAKERVAVQIFGDAPSIPALQQVLFDGCGNPLSPGNPNQSQGPNQGPAPDSRKRSYLDIAIKAHEAGYTPSVVVLPERFKQSFNSKEEALTWVSTLKKDFPKEHMERLSQNVEPFLKEKEGKVEFCIATKAAIIWWDV